jgi:hypothetical protein
MTKTFVIALCGIAAAITKVVIPALTPDSRPRRPEPWPVSEAPQ